MMNSDHLESFLAVARHASYTRAGEDLHLSQSAVWRQMRQLESVLGVPLFEQLGRKLHLTEAGLALKEEAEALLGHIGRVEEIVRAHGEEVHGRLRLGASTTPGFYLLPPVLGAFHARHPGVDLHFEVDNSAAIELRLVRNELDLAFVGGRLAHPELATRTCLDDEVVCFTAPSHPLAARKRVRPAALASQLCVSREEGSATRELFERWLSEAAELPSQTMVIRCPEALKTIVASGVGFSFLSSHGIAAECERGELTRLAVTGMRLRRPVTMAWHVGKHFSPTLRAFVDEVDAAIAGEWSE